MHRILVATIFGLTCSVANALPFQNGSFELPSDCSNQFNVTGNFAPGWTVVQGNIDFEGSVACGGWQASNGVKSLDMVGASAGGVGGVAQTFDTVAGVTYRVSFDMAGNTGAGPVIKPLSVEVGGTVLLAAEGYSFDTTGHTGLSMGWTEHTFTFTANSASSTITFVSDVSASGGSLNAGAALDNVRIVPLVAPSAAMPVPLEWSALAGALAVALAAFWLRRRGAIAPRH